MVLTYGDCIIVLFHTPIQKGAMTQLKAFRQAQQERKTKNTQ